MALMPRFFNSEFGPMFRFMDDYAKHTRSDLDRGDLFSPSSMLLNSAAHPGQCFQPRFDVTETAEAYELHGELPGVAQKDVVLEFTDAQALAIRGSTDVTWEDGERPKGLVEDDKAVMQDRSNTLLSKNKDSSNKKDVAPTKADAVISSGNEANDTMPKRWVMERTSGSFARSFIFPERVDQDSVRASLKDGVLTVRVPKLPAREGKKIQIE